MKLIYVGPSGYGIDKNLLEGWQVLPPCKQSDIINDIEIYKPTDIAIVDGLYMSVPSPWHKEILIALGNNINVYGLSSMGALRAAELDTFGMVGFGKVYEYIRDNEPLDDSIVALMHEDKGAEYRPITVAKIEIIFVLLRLKEEEKISSEHFSLLSQLIEQKNFQSLSLNVLKKIFRSVNPGLENLLSRGLDFSVKREDFENFLKFDISKKSSRSPQKRFKLEKTPYILRQYALDSCDGTGSELIDRIKLSTNLYTAAAFPDKFDFFCLLAHARLLIQELYNFSEQYNKNTFIYDIVNQFLNLDLVSTRDPIAGIKIPDGIKDVDALKNVLDSILPVDLIDNISIDQFFYFVNFSFHPRISGKIGKCSPEICKKSWKVIQINIKLSLLLFFLTSGMPLHYGVQDSILSTFQLKGSCRADECLEKLFFLYLERVRNFSLIFYCGSLLVTQYIQKDQLIMDNYADFLNYTDSEIPYRLYRDSISSNQKESAIGFIRNLNDSRILPVRPKFSLSSHFFEMKYFIRFCTSYI